MISISKRVRILTLLVSLVFGSTLGKVLAAEDTKVLTVRNRDENSYFDLYITVNEHLEAQGLRMYDREDKDWTEFKVVGLKKGVVLKQEGSHKVIVLQSSDFEEDRGGHFKVDYLHNGITGARGEMPIKFDFDGTSWKVFHAGEEIKMLDFKLKKFLGKTIGIDKVIAK